MQSGSVLLDGVPLPQIQHPWLHSQVAIVAQEPVLFADTLFANIAFGLPKGAAEASQSQVLPRAACEMLLPAAALSCPGHTPVRAWGLCKIAI